VGAATFADRYRVDDVPWPIRLPYLALTEIAGGVMAAYLLVVHKTSRIVFEGDRACIDGAAPVIQCVWHENVLAHVASGIDFANHVWMNHPSWYMRPVHVTLRWFHVSRLVLGSSAHDGRRAAEGVVEALRAGHATAIYPDGPSGPRRELKRGVLHIAAQSGAPVVPIAIDVSRAVRLGTWDAKIVPLPFGTLRLTIGDPISVTPAALDDAAQALVRAL
jgi:lysophospholipid acyltransferase (LPLAT)-like uncharacterized protein